MLGIRVIPVLLLEGDGLVKTRRFAKSRYVGDPINTVKIFNEKEVDEICLLNIEVSKQKTEPNYELLEEIAGECFVPLGYGGGLKTISQMKRVLRLGFEKVILNTVLFEDLSIVRAAANEFGSQSVVGSIDVKKNWLGKKQVFSHASAKVVTTDPVAWAEKLVDAGVGELVVTSVDHEGELRGCDLDLLAQITEAVSVPVIAHGGVGNQSHILDAVRKGSADAVAAGSFFVFHGRHQAVLLSFPTEPELQQMFPERICPSMVSGSFLNASLDRPQRAAV